MLFCYSAYIEVTSP